MCLFSSPKVPAPLPVAEAPKLQDPAVQRARGEEKRRARGSQGAAGNILTSPLGITGSPASTSKPILGV